MALISSAPSNAINGHDRGTVNGTYSQLNGASNDSSSPEPSISLRAQVNGILSPNGNDLHQPYVSLTENAGTSTRSGHIGDHSTSGQVLSSRANGAQNGPPKRLQRAKTEQDLTRDFSAEVGSNESEQNWELRHGWEEQYNSEEYLHLLSSV